MLKFVRGNSHETYSLAPRNRKLRICQTGLTEYQVQDPGPPENINLETLKNFAAQNEPQTPQNISLENLVAYSKGQSSICSAPLGRNETGRTANASLSGLPQSRYRILNQLSQIDGTVTVAVGSSSAITPEPGPSSTRDEKYTASTTQVRNKRRSENQIRRIRKTVSTPALPTIRNKRRYEKPAASLGLTEESIKEFRTEAEPLTPMPASKSNTKAEKRERTTLMVQKKHEILLEKLKELNVGENLEVWLKSVNIPKEINIPELRAKITEFLKNKSWESGNSKWHLDGSLTKRLWQDFKELSTAKQVVIIIALSILIALVGFLTLQLLSLLWPGLLGLATSGESILVEIGVEAFKQRQEPAFHLLMNHAEQAKPLTTAWANQYVLWKYMRRP